MLCSEKEYDNGVRDKGRAGMRLDDFERHDFSKEAKLKTAELLALRLYSLSSYKVTDSDHSHASPSVLLSVAPWL